ncbi:hypothetical protein HD554DRAFT_2171179 [Boletus coccyginus]|nr:hypothetical protein HD554DRAFT_2171179 [Boletus coccyginus]
MEDFISGYPGCEFQIRVALADVVGPAKSAFFFNKFESISSKKRMPRSRVELQALSR